MAFINGALTDLSSFAVAVEETPGELPTTPVWEYYEPNSITDMGETIGTTERNPITNDRMRRKGGVTSLTSNVGFDSDLTYAMFNKFAQGFFFSSWNAQDSFVPTAVTTSGYTVASGGDLAAGTLVYARNYENSTNNGLKVCDTSTLTTEIEVTGTLVAEASPPASARVDVVGIQGGLGDITMDASGNLASTSLDFTTLGLVVGQRIYIGGGTSTTSFGTSGDGFARVRAIAANALTLDKTPSSFTSDAAADRTIQIFIGSFIKNVPYSDGSFLTETYTFEVVYDWATDEYHYPNGNYANTMSITANMQDKATVSYGFIGLDTPLPTTSRASGSWTSQYDTVMLNTSTDVVDLRMETSAGTEILSSTESIFQDLSLTIDNGITPKYGIGSLGAVLVAIGNFSVDISATAYFATSQPKISVRGNDTVSLGWCMSNENGALYFDIPSMTLGDGGLDFPANDTINLNLTGMSFKDNFFGYGLSTTKFPHLPV